MTEFQKIIKEAMKNAEAAADELEMFDDPEVMADLGIELTKDQYEEINKLYELLGGYIWENLNRIQEGWKVTHG